MFGCSFGLLCFPMFFFVFFVSLSDLTTPRMVRPPCHILTLPPPSDMDPSPEFLKLLQHSLSVGCATAWIRFSAGRGPYKREEEKESTIIFVKIIQTPGGGLPAPPDPLDPGPPAKGEVMGNGPGRAGGAVRARSPLLAGGPGSRGVR